MTFNGLFSEEIHAIDKFMPDISFTEEIRPSASNPAISCLVQEIGKRFPLKGMSIADAVIVFDDRFMGQELTVEMTVTDVRYNRREALLQANLFSGRRNVGYASITIQYLPEAVVVSSKDLVPSLESNLRGYS